MNKKQLPLYLFYVTVLGIILLFFFRSCGETETVQEMRDTVVVIRTSIDTVFFPSEPKTVFIPVNKYDTVWINDSVSHRIYTNHFNDSLIEATLKTEVDGVLISNELTYVPLFPKYIHRIDSIFRDFYITSGYPAPSNSLYGGLFVKGSKVSFDFGPSLGYSSKNGTMVQYGYNILNKEHTVGIFKRINF